MAKKNNTTEMSGAQELYNFLFEACNILRGPVSQDNFKDYITPILYFKRISDVYDEETEAADTADTEEEEEADDEAVLSVSSGAALSEEEDPETMVVS